MEDGYEEYDDDSHTNDRQKFMEICRSAIKELNDEGFFDNDGIDGKREYFLVVYEDDEDKFEEYLIQFNPNINEWQKRFNWDWLDAYLK